MAGLLGPAAMGPVERMVRRRRVDTEYIVDGYRGVEAVDSVVYDESPLPL